jgi:hypothetical protein
MRQARKAKPRVVITSKDDPSHITNNHVPESRIHLMLTSKWNQYYCVKEDGEAWPATGDGRTGEHEKN